MSPLSHRTHVIDAIGAVAPDIETSALADDVDIVEEFDLDSMDQVNIAAAILKRTGIDIPERVQAQLRTLQEFVAYLDRAGAGRGHNS